MKTHLPLFSLLLLFVLSVGNTFGQNGIASSRNDSLYEKANCPDKNCTDDVSREIFPTSDAIWTIKVPSDNEYEFLIYGLYGDTIINNVSYSKMYLMNDTLLLIDEKDVYVGGIRINNEEVWMKPNAKDYYNIDREEFLMYDFSKKEGETVYHGSMPYADILNTWNRADFNQQESYIQSVKDEAFGGKVLFTTSRALLEVSSEWIEGIGSTNGLFFLHYNIKALCCYHPNQHFLIGMKHYNKLKYLDPRCNGILCENYYHASSASIDSDKANTVRVEYNVQQKTIDATVVAADLPCTFELIDMQGQIVFRESLTEGLNSINPRNTIKGVYIYRIAGANISQSGKLIL